MSPDDPRHGTNAGYLAHRRNDEDACMDCRAARARFERYRRYDAELGRPRKLPSLGARRRVRALQRMGWSLRMIAADAGWNSPEALQYVMRSESVNRRSWWRIAAAYERLSMRVPPITSATARARNRAIRLKYSPPLAWDDIDDPNETPRGLGDERGHLRESFDHVIVERVLGGEFNLPTTTAEKAEVCRSWVARGGQISDLAALTGWRTDRYYKVREVA